MNFRQKNPAESRLSTSPFNRDWVKNEKRAEILRIAGKMFCAIGYSNITVEDIATELGLTKTIIYYYFKNKQALFRECHLLATQSLERAFADTRSEDPLVHLSGFLNTYVRYLIGAESPGAVLLDVELLPDEDRIEITTRREAVYTKILALLDELVAEELIRAVDTKLTMISIMGMINIVPKWYDATGPWKPNTVADHLERQIIHGLVNPAMP